MSPCSDIFLMHNILFSHFTVNIWWILLYYLAEWCAFVKFHVWGLSVSVFSCRPVQSVHLVTGDRRYKWRRMSSVTLFSPPQLVVLLKLCRPKWIILSWKVGGAVEPQRAAANISADLVKPWLRSASYLSSNAAQGECGHLVPQPVRFIPSLPLCLSPSLSSTHSCAHVHTYTQWPFKVFPGYFLVN